MIAHTDRGLNRFTLEADEAQDDDDLPEPIGSAAFVRQLAYNQGICLPENQDSENWKDYTLQ
jgi:hypothetical protein